VAVPVTVAVGVGRLFFFAEPDTLTLADDMPAVASLLIAILADISLPSLVGANSTVTVDFPCGATTAAPCPDVILKNLFPIGGPTVTESGLPPVSSIVKVLVSVNVLPDRSILLNTRMVGVTASLLTGRTRVESPLTRAWALAANSIATTMNEVVAARIGREDARRKLPRPIVTNPPLSMAPGVPRK
jgi:hypothetical protein